MLLAIDPGPRESGWVVFDEEANRPVEHGISVNHKLLPAIEYESSSFGRCTTMGIEMMEPMGMPVGRDVFFSCVWIGAFVNEWLGGDKNVFLISQHEIRHEICGHVHAKFANIRRALIDRIGPIGTKKMPGPLIGVKTHIWSALAVAVAVSAGRGKQWRTWA